MFSVMSDKDYAACKKAKSELQPILFDIDWFLRTKEVIRAYFPYKDDGSVTYKVLDWGATEDEEDIISFNKHVEKFNGFYLNGNKVHFYRIIEIVQEAEEREADRVADRIAQREPDTPTSNTEEVEEKLDLSYPTQETMDLVTDLREQRAKIRKCLEVGVCPKCGGFRGIDVKPNYGLPAYTCKLCGWNWYEEE